jgi:hypothetical protein
MVQYFSQYAAGVDWDASYDVRDAKRAFANHNAHVPATMPPHTSGIDHAVLKRISMTVAFVIGFFHDP